MEVQVLSCAIGYVVLEFQRDVFFCAALILILCFLSLLSANFLLSGLYGWWEMTVPVEGVRYYRFSAVRRVSNVESPRRTAIARVFWADAEGNSVRHDFPATTAYLEGQVPRSESEDSADGCPLAKAINCDDVVVAEVDFGQPAIWQSPGGFHRDILRHRPIVNPLVP